MILFLPGWPPLERKHVFLGSGIDKGHEFPLTSEITLTVIAVVNKAGGIPAFRAVIASPAQAQEATAGCWHS